MNNQAQNHLLSLLETSRIKTDIKKQYVLRIHEGHLTRDENPFSHICVYFAAYDPGKKLVFMGRHIKSGLWLFNGGHLDKGELLKNALYREMSEEWSMIIKTDIESPSLFTITQIENPKKQICQVHYDIWYFIPCDKQTFTPDKRCLASEFFEWGWKSIEQAKVLTHDTATLGAIDHIDNLS